MKEVFTTTEVAKLCHISKQKVVNLFDQGEIEGFRIPGPKGSKSWARRIPLKSLLDFMKRHSIPMDEINKLLEADQKKLLIVEDDAQSQELYQALFADCSEKLTIKVATTGSEAAFMLGSFKPDLVILDIMLPDIDGDQIFTSLQQSHSVDNVNVIVITALSDNEKKDAMMKRGACAYMTKPVDTRLLRDKVLELLEIAPKE